MGIITFFIEQGWKVLALIAGWSFFIAIIRDGGEGIKNLLETISMVIASGCAIIRKKMINQLKKESGYASKHERKEETEKNSERAA